MTAAERIQWLEARRNGIGSSDVPAIFGVSPWKTALNVYLAKVEPADKQEILTGPQEWGLRMEPVIASAIIDRTGWALEKVPTVRHPQYEYLIASPDRANDRGELIEIKTASRPDGWGEQETSDIPQHYYLQCQHQLAVADRETCWVFVLIGGNDFRRYQVNRDADYLPTALPVLSDFWKCVESRTPPEIDWTHPATLVGINRLYTPKPGTFKAMDAGAMLMVDEYERLGEVERETKSQREELKARLVDALGEYETGLLSDGREVVRKLVTRKAYEVKAATFPQLTIRKAKVSK